MVPCAPHHQKMQNMQITMPPSSEKVVFGLSILQAAERVVVTGDDDLGAVDDTVAFID